LFLPNHDFAPYARLELDQLLKESFIAAVLIPRGYLSPKAQAAISTQA